MLDRTNSNTPDTTFMLEKDLVADASGNLSFPSFGGVLRTDNTVRFNISRYIQSIVTRHVANDTLRLYAPLRTRVYNSTLHGYLDVNVNRAIATGRIVLGGGSYADTTMQLRLRIVYSDL